MPARFASPQNREASGRGSGAVSVIPDCARVTIGSANDPPSRAGASDDPDAQPSRGRTAASRCWAPLFAGGPVRPATPFAPRQSTPPRPTGGPGGDHVETLPAARFAADPRAWTPMPGGAQGARRADGPTGSAAVAHPGNRDHSRVNRSFGAVPDRFWDGSQLMSFKPLLIAKYYPIIARIHKNVHDILWPYISRHQLS